MFNPEPSLRWRCWRWQFFWLPADPLLRLQFQRLCLFRSRLRFLPAQPFHRRPYHCRRKHP